MFENREDIGRVVEICINFENMVLRKVDLGFWCCEIKLC